MNLKSYPVLSTHLSVTKVVTEKGEDLLLYDTVTGTKAYLNKNAFEFVRKCRGDKSLERIISEFSTISKDPPEKIQKDLLPLIETMENRKMIFFVSNPPPILRPEPCEAHLIKRLPSIMFEVTRKCNLQCKHCYNDSGTPRNGELTRDEIRKIIDEAASIGVLNVVITGGEPLLRLDLLDIIAYIRQKPMSVMLFTNGTLVTGEVAQTLKDLGVVSVAISLDGGTASTNDTFRGVKGSFERTLRAITMLKDADIHIRLNICIHKDLVDEFPNIITLFKEREITEYSILPISYTGRSEYGDVIITPEEYKKVLRHLKHYEDSKEGAKKEFSYNPQQTNCGIGMSSLTIWSDGTVTPCPSFTEEMIIGDIRKNSLAEIWNNSPLLQRMRLINASENNACKECRYIKVCGGGCMADHYRRTRELGCYNPLECAYYEVYSDYDLVVAKKQPRLSVEIR